MQLSQRFLFLSFFCVLTAGGPAACQGSGANAGGSEPINDREKVEYDRALNRCLKSGGTRIVKILNSLHCY